MLMIVAFAENSHSETTCSNLIVEIFPEEGYAFLTKEKVQQYLSGGKDSFKIEGRQLSDVHLGQLERILEADAYVENAEVYSDMNGTLHVKVFQRKPIARIMRSDGSGFYIDAKGMKFPVAEFKPARVMIVSGHITEPYLFSDTLKTPGMRSVYALATYVDKDEFFQSLIDQVVVEENGDISFFTILGNHRVMLGNTEFLDEKMKSLAIFYKKMMGQAGWSTYRVLNLKYRGQVIGEK